MTTESRTAPEPTDPRAKLGAIAGRWRTDGRVLGDPPAAVSGTDVYELFPGGHFLVHHVEVTVGDRPVRAIEIIGERDPAEAGRSDIMLARAYDDTGATTIMRVRIDESGAWRFSGGPDIAPAARPGAVAPTTGGVRATLRVGEDRTTMAAVWERTEDGATWVPWMDIRFTRLG